MKQVEYNLYFQGTVRKERTTTQTPYVQIEVVEGTRLRPYVNFLANNKLYCDEIAIGSATNIQSFKLQSTLNVQQTFRREADMTPVELEGREYQKQKWRKQLKTIIQNDVEMQKLDWIVTLFAKSLVVVSVSKLDSC